jgi:formaldehyde-activating enzyme involved in methanogenesis
VIYRFNAFSVRQAVEKDLLASDNPFALVILAAKYQMKTRKDAQKRYSFKRKLVNLALKRKYERPTIIALLRFVHLLISLPKTLEIQFEQELVKQLKNNDAMELTQSQKRIAHTVYEAVYGQSLEERDLQQQVVEKTNIARRLLKLRTLTIEQVAETTNLPVATIKSIQEDLTKE